MTDLTRLKNRMLARISSYIPSLSRHFINSYTPMTSVDIPWTPVSKTLSESKIAVVTTAGVHHKDQMPFNMSDREGDPTFRVIDSRRPVSDLMITHDYYDHSDADKDINIVFPIDRLREFEAEGIIAKVADEHYGFMGHIDDSYINVLINRYAPEVARRLKKDNIDSVLLIPGWGICNQSVGLIQREIERTGIATIGISIARKFTEAVKPPRTIFLKWPFGHPLGEPHNVLQQRAVLSEAFLALYSIKTPGEVIDIPYRWKREVYDELNIMKLLEQIK